MEKRRKLETFVDEKPNSTVLPNEHLLFLKQNGAILQSAGRPLRVSIRLKPELGGNTI